MLKANDFINSYEDPTTNVDYDAEKEKRYENNLHVLKRVIQIVKVYAKQGLPFRRHRDNSTNEFSRDGNFIAALKSFAEIDTVLDDHLETGPKNAQMKSWKIQNEIIACIAEVIRRHIRLTLNNTKYFCLIADEVTDSYANKEILLVCLRYIDLLREKPVIQETFLDLIHVQGRPTGKVIGTHILNILDKHQINLKHCRAQVYDRASAMSSSNKGASTIVKEQQPKANYVHFRSHCINLAVAFSCKNEVVTNFLDDLSSVYYYKKSLKVCESNCTHNIGLSKTRWVERFKAYDNYFILYRFVVSVFESITDRNMYSEFYEHLETEINEKWSWDRET